MASILRNENGRIWEYAVKRNGKISQAGHVVTQAEAEALVASGEATFEAGSDPARAACGSEELGRLASFGRSVRETGLTGGRDADVLDAVKAGYLSESAAMNTDD